MARLQQGSRKSNSNGPKLALFVSSALASMALAGCTAAAPPAQTSFAKAQAALQDGKVDSAITHAEAAVLAEPRNAGYRAMLGAAYLEAGRFQSASTAFGEAIELGDSDARTVLSFALTKVALGENSTALAKLSEFETVIPAVDLGLAMALAGQPERGVHYLVNAVRNGESSAKSRQNLAYAYALSGNWRAARVMAAEDVPADQLDARLSDWAATARPEDYQTRVANLLGVTPISDGGAPQYLALANFPSQPMLVAEAQEMRAAAERSEGATELAAAQPSQAEALAWGISDIDTASADMPSRVSSYVAAAPAAAPVTAAAAPAPTPTAAPRTVTPRVSGSAATAAAAATAMAAAPSRGAPRFVSNAVVQNVQAASAESRAPTRVPARAAAPAPQQRMAVAQGAAATHLVQLGSFESRNVAEAKWREFQRRFPQLANHDVVITEARVNGGTFFRVAAAGFGNSSARSMCNSVKSAGVGCFAYAASSPPAGAVDRGVRIAARTR
ncbi:SPOR domain-containing protein [Qipengyuania sp. ASV99]|uniref:SPOR domain-containing protein n=1 Tax=Qipengyuania sp. ASV99 TaxID=3399681 RepID=UPI003A4C5D54